MIALGCATGKFGKSCNDSCHCRQGISCNSTDGHCLDNNCAVDWFGYSCQIPILKIDDTVIPLGLCKIINSPVGRNLGSVSNSYSLIELKNYPVDIENHLNSLVVLKDNSILESVYPDITTRTEISYRFDIIGSATLFDLEYSIQTFDDFSLAYNDEDFALFWGDLASEMKFSLMHNRCTSKNFSKNSTKVGMKFCKIHKENTFYQGWVTLFRITL